MLLSAGHELQAPREQEQHVQFKPLYRYHAIESVILRLTGSGEMAEHERANPHAGYGTYWQAVSPKVIHDAYDPQFAIRQERIPSKAGHSKMWHMGEG